MEGDVETGKKAQIFFRFLIITTAAAMANAFSTHTEIC